MMRQGRPFRSENALNREVFLNRKDVSHDRPAVPVDGEVFFGKPMLFHGIKNRLSPQAFIGRPGKRKFMIQRGKRLI